MQWWLKKKAIKMYKFFVLQIAFSFIEICCNYFCFYRVYNFITGNHLIVNYTNQIFIIFAKTCSSIPNIIFFTYMLFTLDQHLSLFHFWFDLHFLPSNLHLHLHDTCFVNVISFIPVIIINTLRIRSPVLFGTHTLLDKSFTVLQLPTDLSTLTANG